MLAQTKQSKQTNTKIQHAVTFINIIFKYKLQRKAGTL